MSTHLMRQSRLAGAACLRRRADGTVRSMSLAGGQSRSHRGALSLSAEIHHRGRHHRRGGEYAGASLPRARWTSSLYQSDDSDGRRREGDFRGPRLTAAPLVQEDPPAFDLGLSGLYSRLLARVPKGFENFVPRDQRTGDGGDGGGDENKDDKGKAADESKAKSSDAGGGDGGPPDGDDKKKSEKKRKNDEERRRKKKEDEEMQQQLAGTTLLLLLVLAARSFLDDESGSGVLGGSDGPEITWNDFYNYMLTEGDVERIVVVNKKTARVYLRRGARGLPIAGGGAGGARAATRSLLTSQPAKGAAGGDESWDDGTVMEMSPESSGAGSGGSLASSLSTLTGSRGPGGPSRDHQLTYHFTIGSVESFEDKLTHSQQELGVSPRDYVPVQYASETNWAMELVKSAPAIFLIGMTAYMLRGMGGMPGAGGGGRGGMGGIFQMGKSNAKLIKKEDVTVDFSDVAGCTEAKKEIMEFVDFLQDSSQFTRLGAKIPKGALLTGPPGTGKTLLAKAVAGEASVPFYSISGSDFLGKFFDESFSLLLLC